MAWHVFEKLLEGVANYSSFIGKLWITFFFIFRIIIVASIGDTVYHDEQSNFLCNTIQPGCTNVCFNRFSPISQIRFWAAQILFAGMPSVIFVVFALHKLSNHVAVNEKLEETKDRRLDVLEKRRMRRRKKNTDVTQSNHSKDTEAKAFSKSSGLPKYDDVDYGRPKIGMYKVKALKSNSNFGDNLSSRLPVQVVNMEPDRKHVKMKTVYNKDGKSEVMITRDISVAYFTQTILTIVIEAIFIFLQYELYKFKVDEKYLCDTDPCPQITECFVSRPQEKTIFLIFMYIVSCLSIFINLLEILHLMMKYFLKGKGITHKSYLYGDASLRYNGRHISAYPVIGPYPRKHGNSMTDSDNGESIESDYSFYQ